MYAHIIRQVKNQTDQVGQSGRRKRREREREEIYLKYSNTVGTGYLSSGKSALQREMDNTHSICIEYVYIQ